MISKVRSRSRRYSAAFALLLGVGVSTAAPIYQPPGASLTYGDVSHGQPVATASGNPAAAAADQARSYGAARPGSAISVSAGLEYGQLDNLFQFYDRLTAGYDPGEPGTGGGPGQLPEDKPAGGIDLGEIWDSLDPDAEAAIDAVADELSRQAVLLGVIRNEGPARAWASGDLPIVTGATVAGGTLSFGLNWSGSARAFGLAERINFDRTEAAAALADWLNQLPIDRPANLPLSDEVTLYHDAASNSARLGIRNDSSIVTKAAQTTEIQAGYSRPAWTGDSGSLYVGVRGRLYLMRLSRLSVRFADITDSEALFDAIKDSDFSNDARIGVDVGALWVANNYQLGAQLINLNRPTFSFPEVDLAPYRTPDIIAFLQRDRDYRMDAQLKLEASMFGSRQRWSAHLGVDANAATDPLGDDYQWVTLSAGFRTENRWLPGFRLGYRENVAGTRVRYVSVGLSAFEFLDIDLAASLDTASIDGRDLPRGLMASMGFRISW